MREVFVNLVEFSTSNKSFKQISFYKNFKVPKEIYNVLREINFDNLNGIFSENFNCLDVSNYYLNSFKKSSISEEYKMSSLYLKGNLLGNGKFLPNNFKYSTHYISCLKKGENYYLFDFSISYLSKNIIFNIYLAVGLKEVLELLKIVYADNYLKIKF